MGLERSSPNRGSLSSGRSRAAARVLRSSQMAAAAAEPGGTFVVVEVGARYAPWAMRAVKAAEVLGRSSKFHVVALEPDTRHVGWIHEHFKMNGMGPTSDRHTLDVVQGFFSHTERATNEARGEKKEKKAEKALAGRRLGGAHCIASLLEGVDHVDFLDIDAQGSEKVMFTMAHDREAFRKKVRRTHIETHSDSIWKIVADHLLEMNFKIVQNATWMYTAYTSSTFGPTWWRGGGLYAINPALVPC